MIILKCRYDHSSRIDMHGTYVVPRLRNAALPYHRSPRLRFVAVAQNRTIRSCWIIRLLCCSDILRLSRHRSAHLNFSVSKKSKWGSYRKRWIAY